MLPACSFIWWLYMSGFKTTQELLEEIPVRCLVIHLGIPAMFGQLFNILYNTADRIFIGKIPETGSLCLASIGICAPALTALTAFAFMIGIGGASYMSISLGQKEERRAREIIGNAFFMILVISAIVTPLLLLNCEKILYLLGSRDMYPYAETYFTIYVCGTFASLLGCGLNQFILAWREFTRGYIDYLCCSYPEFYDDSSLPGAGDYDRMWNDIQLSLWGRKLYKDPAGFSLCVFIVWSIYRGIGNYSAGIARGVCGIFSEGAKHGTACCGQYPHVYVCIAGYCGTICSGGWPDCNGKGQICTSVVTVS